MQKISWQLFESFVLLLYFCYFNKFIEKYLEDLMNKIGLKYQNFKTSTLMLSLLPFLVAY